MKGASPWVRGGADAAAPSSHRVPSASTQACARESSRHVRARDRGASHKVDSRTRLGACGNGICGRGRCPCPNSAMLMPRLNLGTRFPKSLADRHAGASRAPSISFDSCGPFGGRQYVQLSAWFDMMSSKVSGGSLRRSWTRRAVLNVWTAARRYIKRAHLGAGKGVSSSRPSLSRTRVPLKPCISPADRGISASGDVCRSWHRARNGCMRRQTRANTRACAMRVRTCNFAVSA